MASHQGYRCSADGVRIGSGVSDSGADPFQMGLDLAAVMQVFLIPVAAKLNFSRLIRRPGSGGRFAKAARLMGRASGGGGHCNSPSRGDFSVLRQSVGAGTARRTRRPGRGLFQPILMPHAGSVRIWRGETAATGGTPARRDVGIGVAEYHQCVMVPGPQLRCDRLLVLVTGRPIQPQHGTLISRRQVSGDGVDPGLPRPGLSWAITQRHARPVERRIASSGLPMNGMRYIRVGAGARYPTAHRC